MAMIRGDHRHGDARLDLEQRWGSGLELVLWSYR